MRSQPALRDRVSLAGRSPGTTNAHPRRNVGSPREWQVQSKCCRRVDKQWIPTGRFRFKTYLSDVLLKWDDGMKALVVEDDLDLLDLLTYGLGRDGYSVTGAIDGEQGIQRWRSDAPDIVLVDINLPKLNGFEVCRHIRENSRTPIIIISARNGDEDVVRALRLGADDYVSKPFSHRQLRARMEAVLRRSTGELAPELSGGLRVEDLTLDPQTFEASFRGKPIQLTRVEFRILYILAANAGRIVPYSRLFEYGWGYDAESCGRDSELLKAHVSHVRDKLGLRNGSSLSIMNMRGVGYALKAKEPHNRFEEAS